MRLQERKETEITEEWVYILDSTELEKQYAKVMQIIKYYKDTTGKKKWVKGYQMLSVCCTNGSTTYPAAFGFKTPFNNKIDAAIKHIDDLLKIKLPIGKAVFDEWFFAVRLLQHLTDNGIVWVSRPKPRKNFTVDGVTMKPAEIMRKYSEVIAEITGYKGKVKIFRVHGKKKWYLLVTNDTEMTREEAIETYSKRMIIDKPFFSDMKSVLDIEGFHTRNFASIVNHVAMRLLLHILLTVTKIRKGWIQKSIEWVKKKIISAVGTVKRKGKVLIIKLLRDTRPPPD